MTQPLVSVLIPVYNRERMVRRAIESALQQTYPAVEVIVVDNCSTDRTFEVVREYADRDPRVRAFRNPENLGAIRNWRKCVEYSSGEFVKIVFSDDWLEPKAIEELVPPLIANRQFGFSYCAVRIRVEGSDRSHRAYGLRRGAHSSNEYLNGVLDFDYPVSPGCALFRREDAVRWLVADGFSDACFKKGMGNDLLLFLRACDEYPEFFHVNAALANFTSHPGSITVASNNNFSCYDMAYAWFLSIARMLPARRRRCHAILLARAFSLSQLRRNGSPFRAYSSMFPAGYDAWDLDYFYMAKRIPLRFLSRVARGLKRRWQSAEGRPIAQPAHDREGSSVCCGS